MNLKVINLFLFLYTVIPATYYKYVDVIKAGNIEVRGLKLEQVSIRNNGQKYPSLEFYSFQPYVSDKVNNIKIIILCIYIIQIYYFQPTVYALATCVQLAFENSGGAFKLKVTEIGTGRKLESLYAKSVIDVINTEPMSSVSIEV